MRTKRGLTRATGVAVVLASSVILGTGCVASGGDTYEEFRSALEAKAPCSELFDQRMNFDDEETLAKIDADLEEIGCDSPSSERKDA